MAKHKPINDAFGLSFLSVINKEMAIIKLVAASVNASIIV